VHLTDPWTIPRIEAIRPLPAHRAAIAVGTLDALTLTRVMSELSGVFDQLADALKASGASPSTTLRQHRPARRHGHASTQTFASRPIPQGPPSFETTIELDGSEIEVIPAKPPRRKRDVDRSRDHAVYAAPHRPMRPHAHSRPDDIVTERILRRALTTATKAGRGLPITLIAFVVTVALGLGALFVTR
jgi:hypothetical protein